MLPAARGISTGYRNSPARRTLCESKFAFENLQGMPSAYTNTTIELTLDAMRAEATAIATEFPAIATLETVSTLASGRQIKALRINDNGVRPVVLISIGIHGNEIHLARSVMAAARAFADNTNNSILNNARQSVALIVIVGINPDGAAAGTRQNAAGVNLNRNWPWFWAETLDTDKGTAAANQPEVITVQAWAMSFVRRVILTLDTHAWNSKTTWGFLVEQIYHTPEAERTQRMVYHYSKNLIAKRNWAGFTIVNATPDLLEYRSHRKPYLYTWFRQYSRPDAVGYLIEVPETENIGVISTVGLDVVLGAFAAAVDATKARNLHGQIVTPALAVVNSNSNFNAWNVAENRPSFFNYVRSDVTGGAEARRRFRIKRRLSDAYPFTERSAYCAHADITFVAGGINSAGLTASCYSDNAAGAISISQPLPEALQSGAIATDGTQVWFYGGVNTAVAYSDKLYVKSWTGTDAWVLSASVTYNAAALALQRHTMHFFGGFLYAVGGRTSGAVSRDIYKINPTTGAATLFAQLSGLTQRHTSWLRTDGEGFIYVFGGDGGATTKTTIEKLNLTTAARVVIAAVLPAARNRQVITATATTSVAKVYIALGTTIVSPTLAGEWSAAIYLFNAATETIQTLNYALESAEDDHGDVVTIPAPNYANGIARYKTSDDMLSFMGGVNLAGLANEVWEMPTDSLTMGLRRTGSSHGYIRATQAFNTIDGEKYALVTRASSDTTISATSMVQCTGVLVVGQLSVGTVNRYVDPIRRVPPRTPSPISVPVYIRAGEGQTSGLRAYFRMWTPGKELSLSGGFQLLKVTDTKAMAAFDLLPTTTAAAVSITHRLNITTGAVAAPKSGVFSPYWGSRVQINQQVMGFAVAGGLTSMELWFSATDSTTELANGAFELRWTAGTLQTFIFPTIELNHSRFEIEWRRDMVFWRIAPTTTGLIFSLWFYGRLMTVSIACSVSTISEYTMTGSGVIDHGPYL